MVGQCIIVKAAVSAMYLFVLHLDEFLCLRIRSGQGQNGDGALHPVVLSQFTVRHVELEEQSYHNL